MPPGRAGGVVAALAAAILFGAVNAASRFAIEGGLQPPWVSALSYAVGGAALSPALRHARIAPADRPRLAVVVIVGAVVAPLLLFDGLARTTAVDARRSSSTSRWRSRPSSPSPSSGSECAAVGSSSGSSRWRPAPCSCRSPRAPRWAARPCWASRWWRRPRWVGASTTSPARPWPRGTIRARALVAWKTLLGGGLVLAASLLVVGAPGGSPLDWAVAALAGLLGVAVSSVLFYRALAALGATRTTVLFSANGLGGGLLGWLVLGEPFTWLHAAGAVVILSGAALVAFARVEG
jgi:drug/metabolite transporter (DMT)-like permease